MRMHKWGHAKLLRLCGLVCMVTLAGQAWSPAGADAQEAAVGAPVLAEHINTLRAQVQAQVPACSSVFRWTDDPIEPRVTPVKADHIVELRRAINDIAQGQCPSLLEQVTFEAVEFTNLSRENNRVEGYVVNSGSTPITGTMNVRVRFFGADNTPIVEDIRSLRHDRGDRYLLETLGVQIRRPFYVEFGDSEIQDWSYFQVVAFEVEDRSVLCSGCNQRHVRPREQVTFEVVGFRDADRYVYVEGWIVNSGPTPITGTMNVRVRFFGADNTPIVEDIRSLRHDRGDRYLLETLGVQIQRPFYVRFDASATQGWGYYQVVSFEDDGRRIPCVGCDQQRGR